MDLWAGVMAKKRQLTWRGGQMDRHKPVYKGRLHTQTMNNEVSEDVLV